MCRLTKGSWIFSRVTLFAVAQQYLTTVLAYDLLLGASACVSFIAFGTSRTSLHSGRIECGSRAVRMGLCHKDLVDCRRPMHSISPPSLFWLNSCGAHVSSLSFSSFVDASSRFLKLYDESRKSAFHIYCSVKWTGTSAQGILKHLQFLKFFVALRKENIRKLVTALDMAWLRSL